MWNAINAGGGGAGPVAGRVPIYRQYPGHEGDQISSSHELHLGLSVQDTKQC